MKKKVTAGPVEAEAGLPPGQGVVTPVVLEP